MSRLPSPGGDSGIWGDLLNDFLMVAHQPNGQLSANSVGSVQLQPNSVLSGNIRSVGMDKVSGLSDGLGGVTAKNMHMLLRAAGYIRSVMRPMTRITSDSIITTNGVYDVQYTGPVSGTFSIVGHDLATEQLCPIRISTPVGNIADAYFGVVTGTIVGYAGLPAGTYTVQAYKSTDSDYLQPASAVVDAGGGFSLDLGTVPDTRAGAWRFALLDAGGGQVGQKWPQAESYRNIVVKLCTVTDTVYDVAQQPASVNGTFMFASSSVGKKLLQLVDTSNGEVLSEAAPASGCVRSYVVEPSEPGYGTNFPTYCYSYDQAICTLAMLALGDFDTAKQLISGLLEMQVSGAPHDGAFKFSGPQLAPGYGNSYLRTGAHAIATYALLCYIESCPMDASRDYADAAHRALAYIDTLLSGSSATAGLYLGGSGSYATLPGEPERFNQGYDITWAATEHNLDTWHTLNKAAAVLNDSALQAKADTLKQNILSKLWDQGSGRFYQGMQPTGPDASDPLDMHSWGAIWLSAIGRSDLAAQAMSDTALGPFVYTSGTVSGYMPAYPSGGYPGISSTVWSEGSFGVSLAYLALRDMTRWQSVLDKLAGWQESDGSFRYVTDYDATYEFTTSRSAAGTAWAILAVLGHGIWSVTAPR